MSLGYKVFGGLIGIVLLIWFVPIVWHNPDWWNATANDYKSHRNRLQVDSLHWRKDSLAWRVDSLALRDTLARKNTIIQTQQSEWQKAISYGQEWKGKWAGAVAVSDAQTDRLSSVSKQLAYYRLLQQNGTLGAQKLYSEAQRPDEGDLLTAGLKTARRDSIKAVVIDSLAIATGLLQTATQRMGKGLRLASARFGELSAQAALGMKRGIPILSHKSRKLWKAQKIEADKGKAEADSISELERYFQRP